MFTGAENDGWYDIGNERTVYDGEAGASEYTTGENIWFFDDDVENQAGKYALVKPGADSGAEEGNGFSALDERLSG